MTQQFLLGIDHRDIKKKERRKERKKEGKKERKKEREKKKKKSFLYEKVLLTEVPLEACGCNLHTRLSNRDKATPITLHSGVYMQSVLSLKETRNDH